MVNGMISLSTAIIGLGILGGIYAGYRGIRYAYYSVSRTWKYRWISIKRVPRWVWTAQMLQPNHDGTYYTHNGKKFQYRVMWDIHGNSPKFYKRRRYR